MFSNFRKLLIRSVTTVAMFAVLSIAAPQAAFSILSFVSSQAEAGVTFVQSNQSHSTTGSTQNLTSGSITVTAHHSLIVWAVTLDSNVVAITDTAGNTYVPAGFSTIFGGTF